MGETAYQNKLSKKIKRLFPGAIVLKNDPDHIQGFPDLTILYGPYWAVLEVKASREARLQPNQEYYVEQLDNMSFSAFIYPENEEKVLNELQLAFGVSR